VLNSDVAPGAKMPPRSSSASRSRLPDAPDTLIVSVFVVVAPPQGTGVSPKAIAPLWTETVASPPGVIEAVTVLLPAS
jgi:hypothetical protein